ncbi:MAG: hypothetical protein PF689_14125 [Deltaproteobacteria bacterium]|nr:hypothetical protein [Deltaproteobacteria bacterium]
MPFFLIFGYFYYSSYPFTIGKTRDNIARALIRETGMYVNPHNIILAQPLSSEAEFFPRQHTIFFLAAQNKDNNNDVYSAQIFLSKTGIPFTLTRIINLSKTPACNEKQMVNWKNRLAFVSKNKKNIEAPPVVTVAIINKIKIDKLLTKTQLPESEQVFISGKNLFSPFYYKITPASKQNRILLKWEKGILKFIETTKTGKVKKYKFDPVKGRLISKHKLRYFSARGYSPH